MVGAYDMEGYIERLAAMRLLTTDGSMLLDNLSALFIGSRYMFIDTPPALSMQPAQPCTCLCTCLMSMHMSIHMSIHMCIHVHMHVRRHVYTCLYTCLCTCLMSMHMSMPMSIPMFSHMSVHMSTYTYLHI